MRSSSSRVLSDYTAGINRSASWDSTVSELLDFDSAWDWQLLDYLYSYDYYGVCDDAYGFVQEVYCHQLCARHYFLF